MTDRDIKCLIQNCNAIFFSEAPMKRHLTKFHKMSKKEIDACDKFSEFKKNPLNCPGCDAIFWNKITLKKHVKDKCLPEKLVCIFCNGIFWTRVDLKKHVINDCEKKQVNYSDKSRIEQNYLDISSKLSKY